MATADPETEQRSFTNRLHSKFLSSFLSLNSVLLLNKFAITSDPLYISASSLRRLHSSQRHDLFMPRVRAINGRNYRSFDSIGLSLWNRLLSHFHSFILSAPLSLSLSRVKSYLFPGTEMHLKRFCWLTPREGLYEYLYTTQYTTIHGQRNYRGS